jgi:hypothetical protein
VPTRTASILNTLKAATDFPPRPFLPLPGSFCREIGGRYALPGEAGSNFSATPFMQ